MVRSLERGGVPTLALVGKSLYAVEQDKVNPTPPNYHHRRLKSRTHGRARYQAIPFFMHARARQHERLLVARARA
eukprot:2609006-Pleurochrysis_carterae.AAC.3